MGSSLSKNTLPLEPPNVIPPLERRVSTRIVNQEFGDCKIYSIINLLIKYFRTNYPQSEFFEGFDINNSGYENTSDCDALYLEPNKNLYNCTEKTCGINSIENIEKICTNKGELNTLLFYSFFYSILFKKFGNQGSSNYLPFILCKLYDEEFIKNTFMEYCEFSNKDYCERIKLILIENYNNNKVIFNYDYKLNNTDRKKNIENKGKIRLFFYIIKQIIDKNLYLILTTNAMSLLDLLLATKNQNFIIKKLTDYNPNTKLYDENEWGNNECSINKGHAMVIVSYDYTEDYQKIIIKNTWGKIVGDAARFGFIEINSKYIEILLNKDYEYKFDLSWFDYNDHDILYKSMMKNEDVDNSNDIKEINNIINSYSYNISSAFSFTQQSTIYKYVDNRINLYKLALYIVVGEKYTFLNSLLNNITYEKNINFFVELLIVAAVDDDKNTSINSFYFLLIKIYNIYFDKKIKFPKKLFDIIQQKWAKIKDANHEFPDMWEKTVGIDRVDEIITLYNNIVLQNKAVIEGLPSSEVGGGKRRKTNKKRNIYKKTYKGRKTYKRK